MYAPKNQFYQECHIWKGAQIQPSALRVNGFTTKQVTDQNKKSLKDVLIELFEWHQEIEDKTIAGQNINFDLAFLHRSIKREKIKWHLGHRSIDLHSICYAHHLKNKTCPPQKNNKTSLSLDAIANYVGLPIEPNPHNALTGAKYAAECFSRLIFTNNLLAEHKKYLLPKYL